MGTILKSCVTAAVLTVLTLLDYPVHAEDYPPTDGAMRGFVLLKERTAAPDVPFFDETDAARHFDDFGDKVLLVNFWATWCAPCVREMPDLDELQADMGSEDFAVIAISQDLQGVAKAKPFLREKLGLENLDLYIDKKLRLGRTFQMKGLPTTYLLDRDNRIVGAFTGPADWASPDAKALIRHIIDAE